MLYPEGMRETSPTHLPEPVSQGSKEKWVIQIAWQLGEPVNDQKTKSTTLERDNCFACSSNNPRGLRLDFRQEEDGAMIAEWIPETDLEGYRGIIHGGLVSTVLDEAMAKVVAASGCGALTAELRVRFREQVASRSAVRVKGWIESHGRRMIRTEASLAAPDGKELAHAWATFLPVKWPV